MNAVTQTQAARPLNGTTQEAVRDTVLAPRFYTTDFAAMDRIDVEPVRAQWDALMDEFRRDPNKGHFTRDERFDSFRNLFQSPRVGLMFLIPGKRETLRVGGRAEVVRDAAVLESLNAQGRVPALAIAVHVDEAFFHCSKCMIRSRLWQPEQWAPLDGLPTLAETMKDAALIDAPVEVLAGVIKEDEEQRLY